MPLGGVRSPAIDGSPAKCPKGHKSCPDHDGNIGDVEHTGPKLSNTDVEEVHDAAVGQMALPAAFSRAYLPER